MKFSYLKCKRTFFNSTVLLFTSCHVINMRQQWERVVVLYHDMTKAKAWFETVAYKRNVFELKMPISSVFLLKAAINMAILVWMFFPSWSAFFQTTSNYHARRFGVRAAMPGFIAKRLCPQLIIVPPNFDKYQAVSREVSLLSHSYL